MTESQTFFTFLMLIPSFYWIRKLFRQWAKPDEDREESEEQEIDSDADDEIDLDELADSVDELQNLVKQIRKMQDAVDKIDSCEPGMQHSNFQMKWQSEEGKNQSYDFWADGDSRTNDLLRELYQTEIDRMITSLPDVAEKIYWATHEE